MPTTRRTRGGNPRATRLEETPLPPAETRLEAPPLDEEPDLEFMVYQMHPEFLVDDDDDDEDLESEQAERRILHVRTHVVVETQIRDPRCPFVAEAVAALEGAGVDPHEVRHLLGEIVMHHVWGVVREGRPYDLEKHRRDVIAMVGKRLEECARPRPRKGRRKQTPTS